MKVGESRRRQRLRALCETGLRPVAIVAVILGAVLMIWAYVHVTNPWRVYAAEQLNCSPWQTSFEKMKFEAGPMADNESLVHFRGCGARLESVCGPENCRPSEYAGDLETSLW